MTMYRLIKDISGMKAGCTGKVFGEYVFFPDSVLLAPFDAFVISESKCIDRPDLFQKIGEEK